MLRTREQQLKADALAASSTAPVLSPVVAERTPATAPDSATPLPPRN
jgi:hypothetical protein